MIPKNMNSPVGNVSDGKDMGWHLVPFLPLVDLDDLLSVDGKPLVRVHHHAEQARVGLVQNVWGVKVWQSLTYISPE